MLMMYLGCYTLIAPSEKSRDGSHTRKNSLQEGNTVQETGVAAVKESDNTLMSGIQCRITQLREGPYPNLRSSAAGKSCKQENRCLCT